MVYRNYDHNPKKQDHTLTAVIGTVLITALFITMFVVLTSSLDFWWKLYITVITIWILYGLYLTTKKAVRGKDYCSECGRVFQDKQ